MSGDVVLLVPDLTLSPFQWHISDFLCQNKDKSTGGEENGDGSTTKSLTSDEQTIISGPISALYTPPGESVCFDDLWISLFQKIGDLCIDARPPVRKSAGQTLFSALSAQGDLLKSSTWNTVLWKVGKLVEPVETMRYRNMVE